MSPNSLFAILLRSPWWISVLIAAVLALLARAVLPQEYWVLGATSAFPFVVIALVAAWKQRGRLSQAQVDAVTAEVAALAWPQFAARLEAAFQRDGYSVAKPPANVAADFVLTQRGVDTVVLAKRWKAATTGVETLEQLQALKARQEAGACMVVTIGALSEAARAYAQTHGIKVLQGEALARLLRKV